MRKTIVSLAAAAVLALPLMASAQDVLETPIIGEKGTAIGKLILKGGPNAVIARLTIDAGGLTPGWHGLHFHAVGDCSDVGKFLNSKGHVNHDNKKHGLLNAEGPDQGDLPNLFANADGSVNAEVATNLMKLSGDQGLKNPQGSALVIHALEDDHNSQPIGNAGARVACAVIK